MSRIKSAILKYTPDPILRVVKRFHYARSVARSTLQDIPEHVVLRDLIQPDSVVVDIGANVGVYTKALCELVGPAGKVHSFEPVPLTFGILEHNVRSLKLSQVATYNVALSDHTGVARMAIPDFQQGGENYYEAHISTSDQEASLPHVDIRCATLDSILAEEPAAIAFIKMDVEGHELACAHGAEATLRRSHPALLIEFSSNPDERGSDAQLLTRWLEERGYSSFWWDGQRLQARRAGDSSVDYLFLQPAQADLLRRHMSPGKAAG